MMPQLPYLARKSRFKSASDYTTTVFGLSRSGLLGFDPIRHVLHVHRSDSFQSFISRSFPLSLELCSCSRSSRFTWRSDAVEGCSCLIQAKSQPNVYLYLESPRLTSQRYPTQFSAFGTKPTPTLHPSNPRVRNINAAQWLSRPPRVDAPVDTFLHLREIVPHLVLLHRLTLLHGGGSSIVNRRCASKPLIGSRSRSRMQGVSRGAVIESVAAGLRMRDGSERAGDDVGRLGTRIRTTMTGARGDGSSSRSSGRGHKRSSVRACLQTAG